MIFPLPHSSDTSCTCTDSFSLLKLHSLLFLLQILGMVPDGMLARADEHHRLQFFEQTVPGGPWTIKQRATDDSTLIVPSTNPIESLKQVVEKEAQRKTKRSDEGHSTRQYDLFVDLIYRMLTFRPNERITPTEALQHSFVTDR